MVSVAIGKATLPRTAPMRPRAAIYPPPTPPSGGVAALPRGRYTHSKYSHSKYRHGKRSHSKFSHSKATLPQALQPLPITPRPAVYPPPGGVAALPRGRYTPARAKRG
eukprot:scaffold5397_cov37-Phaeocystis_antarctica.AAC.2